MFRIVSVNAVYIVGHSALVGEC